MPCEREDGDWGGAHIGVSKMASIPPVARRESWNRFSLESLGKKQYCQHPDLGFLVSKTETIHFCWLSHPTCGTLFWQS